MLAAKRLRDVEDGDRTGRDIKIDRQAIEIGSKGLNEIGSDPLAPFTDQRGIEHFVTPERRNNDAVASGNPLRLLRLFVRKTPGQDDRRIENKTAHGLL